MASVKQAVMSYGARVPRQCPSDKSACFYPRPAQIISEHYGKGPYRESYFSLPFDDLVCIIVSDQVSLKEKSDDS